MHAYWKLKKHCELRRRSKERSRLTRAQGRREQWDFILKCKCKMNYYCKSTPKCRWQQICLFIKTLQASLYMNSWRTPLCGWETKFPSIRDPDDCLRRRSIVMRLVAKLPIIWELLMNKINNTKCDNGEEIGPHCIHSLKQAFITVM